MRIRPIIMLRKNSLNGLYLYLTGSCGCGHINVSIIKCYLDNYICQHDTMSIIISE